ncbi:hypothetical protein OIU77_002287 [Salix suchowensis]|uniref:Terpene synthase metal-binding domain-containing protein n=1 Tax=Salix suchowensis TaxID=1278906 RepID=A0ABQ9B605_9ROSI|nr:hypothetical protein OIU77_002287 [Salix suchowensis]
MATEFLSLQRPFSLTHKMYRNPLPRVIHATPMTLKLRCSVSTRNVSLTETETETETRRSANYEPNSWDYDYLLSSDTDDAIELYKDKAKKLDAEVRSKINNETAEFLTQLELIDTIQRLGLGYRFESDIRRALDRYVSSGGLEAVAKTSLQATALSFRLLRQHGFEWADLCNAFLQEAKFLYNKSTPTFDDYFGNAWKSSSGPLQLVFAYFAVVQNIKKEETENLQKYHDIISWPSYIFRLCNDLASASAEIARGETANSVSCYMRTKGISEELATESVMNLIDETWKKMNKEKLGDSLFAKHFVETAINLARQSHCTYHNGDAHTSPDELTRKRVLSVITEPILSLER